MGCVHVSQQTANSNHVTFPTHFNALQLDILFSLLLTLDVQQWGVFQFRVFLSSLSLPEGAG
jgi:hypothetical protein